MAGLEERRKSKSGIWIPLIPGVTPQADRDAKWRRIAAWGYERFAAPLPLVDKRTIGGEVIIDVTAGDVIDVLAIKVSGDSTQHTVPGGSVLDATLHGDI